MSRDRKRQMFWYQVDDGEAIARHLEKMARKGWLLEGVDNWYYTYRRSGPAEVKYTVAFFPDASVFDPALTEGQMDYADYCRAAGWELAAAYGPVQYFRSTCPDPVPIETDEAMRLTVVRRTMRKAFVLIYAVMLLLPAIGLPLAWGQFRQDPIGFFCNNRQLSNLLIMSGILLFAGGMLLDYLVWLLRSCYAVSQGGRCKKPHTRFRLALSAAMLAVCGVSVFLFLTDGSWQSGFFAAYLVGYVLLILLARQVLRVLKRRVESRSAVRALYCAFAVLAGLVLGFSSVFLAPRLIQTQGQGDETYTYTSADGSFSMTREVRHDELPVTLEDLGFAVAPEDHCTYKAEVRRTPLASYGEYVQEALDLDSGLPWLNYRVYESSWPWLLTRCWEVLTKGEEQDPWPMRPVDPAPWGAMEACRREGLSAYFLLYPGRVVAIHLSGEAAPWQLDAIIQALRP